MDNYFVELNSVDVGEHTEKKNNLTYLSWAWAWAEIKKRHPDAQYTIYENANGLFYHTDGRTCWVKTGVTVNGIEHIEFLPVMDYRNQSIPLDKVTSFDVNKAIQRSLTKACARHGLGLYIYAGEDLPEEPKPEKPDFEKEAAKEKTQQTKAINKALKEGKTELPPAQAGKALLKDQFEKSVKYLESVNDLSSKPKSAIDKLNNLCVNLWEADLIEEHGILTRMINERMKLDDEVKY